MKSIQPLPLPPFNPKRWIAVSVIAFGVFSGAAAILLGGLDDADKPDVWLVLGGVVVGSAIVGLSPHVYDVASVALSRVLRYDEAAGKAASASHRLTRAAEYLRGLNTDLAIREIRDEDGTVHLIFPYGTLAGLGEGAMIDIVRRTGTEILGTAKVVQASEDWCSARPVDRTNREFWEGLEDRMKSDFRPPEHVVGRIFRITGSTLLELLRLLEEGAQEV